MFHLFPFLFHNFCVFTFFCLCLFHVLIFLFLLCLSSFFFYFYAYIYFFSFYFLFQKNALCVVSALPLLLPQKQTHPKKHCCCHKTNPPKKKTVRLDDGMDELSIRLDGRRGEWTNSLNNIPTSLNICNLCTVQQASKQHMEDDVSK